MSVPAIVATLVASAFGGYLLGTALHWRVWCGIFQSERRIERGRRIARQFDRLDDYRVRFLDPRVEYRSEMPEEERARLDADVAWWLEASKETQRQAIAWRGDKP